VSGVVVTAGVVAPVGLVLVACESAGVACKTAGVECKTTGVARKTSGVDAATVRRASREAVAATATGTKSTWSIGGAAVATWGAATELLTAAGPVAGRSWRLWPKAT